MVISVVLVVFKLGTWLDTVAATGYSTVGFEVGTCPAVGDG